MQAFKILSQAANANAAMDSANADASSTDQNWEREETSYSFADGSTLIISGGQCNAYDGGALPVYEVNADAETGEWLTEPVHLDHVLKTEWDAKVDSGAIHYDTYEHDGETRAIKVNLQ
jgi:hypothetical protein